MYDVQPVSGPPIIMMFVDGLPMIPFFSVGQHITRSRVYRSPPQMDVGLPLISPVFRFRSTWRALNGPAVLKARQETKSGEYWDLIKALENVKSAWSAWAKGKSVASRSRVTAYYEVGPSKKPMSIMVEDLKRPFDILALSQTRITPEDTD
ncbi:hypothetical protein EDB84DRAFT_1436221 [Lactarius hengduanensis]|nr:hypothetical protein EDB84DRAFT_1436221 [Lactarius hengduanensis]